MAKILIVEDNDMLNQSYQMLLSFHGHDVVTAFNGKEGLVKASSYEPDVILLDYFMPIMDGKQFLLEFKPRKTGDCKIILLTNTDEAEKIDEAYKLGIANYLLKANLAPKQLVAEVNSLLK